MQGWSDDMSAERDVEHSGQKILQTKQETEAPVF